MNYIGVFQGGGVKGIAHLGAVKALEERGFRAVKTAGSSVGAIMASLLSVGYMADELKPLIMEMSLPSLKAKSGKKKFLRFFTEKGIYETEPLELYLEQLYLAKGKRTYRDLKYGGDYNLKVVTTDILKRQSVIIPDDLKKYQIDPDNFSIAKSVVMSATYPFFYKPLKLGKSIMMDGAIYNNFPENVYQNESLPIIGFTFVKESKNTIVKNNNYIIEIAIPKVATMNYKISQKTKAELYLAGYVAGQKFLNKFFK